MSKSNSAKKLLMRPGVSIPRAQRGIALLSVLSIVAIMAVVGAGFFMQQSMALKRTQNQLNYMQAYQLALGAEEMARQVLWEDWDKEEKSKDKVHFDTEDDPWHETVPMPLPEFGPQSGIKIQVRDLHRHFNLNNLFDPDTNKIRRLGKSIEWQQLILLFEEEGLEDKHFQALFDWLDADTEPTGESWEDDGYLGLTPSYRTANHPLQALSELRVLKDMDITKYREIIKKATVLPVAGTVLNINTVEPETIARLFPKVDAAKFKEIQDAGPFETMEDFQEEFKAVVTEDKKRALWVKPASNKATQGGNSNSSSNGRSQTGEAPKLEDYFSVASEYFELRAQATFDGRFCYLISILRRDPTDGKVYLVRRERVKSIDFDEEKDEDDDQA